MRNLFLNLVITAYLIGSVNAAEASLVINEFMASNSGYVQDPQGQYDDWIEIHNFGSNPINVGGMYLTDNLSAPTKWRIPDNNPPITIISAGGYLLIWADEDTTDTGLHANFKLDAAGEQIGLFDSDGVTVIDSVIFGEQTTDTSYGRYPDAGDDWLLFHVPSPRAENITVFRGVVSGVEVSHERGFYDTPFSLTLASETDNAVIYYTLDGTEPYELSGRGASSLLYTAPVTIRGTTCLRAKAFKEGWLPSETLTCSYIFLDDVIEQPIYPEGFPNQWKGSSVDYEMDPDIVYDPRYQDNIKDALTSIPTVSIVMNQDDMFGEDGIYSNASSSGPAWERPASVEMIYPDSTQDGLQVNCGIQILGGASRSMTQKHSFRLLFKGIYGPTKLRFPLFGQDAASEFNTIVLRSSFNDGYGWSGAKSYEQYIRDQFIRTMQQDMGNVSTNGIFAHLYINGLYWGLYIPSERPDASFSASYYGGEEEDWDAFSHSGLNSGNSSAFNQMISLSQEASYSYEAYQQLQGNNPDGTRNTDYPCLLDISNYVDYLLLNYCVNNEDWPWNNYWYARKRTADSTGFKFFCWDSEISLYLPSRAHMELNRTTDFRGVGQLHGNLIKNDEYKLFFADRVHHFLFNDGILTPEYLSSRYLEIADQVEMAIICESARWGDQHHHPPLNQDDWYNMRDWHLENFFPLRYDIVLGQLKDAGLYPNVDAPVFYINDSYQHGGRITASERLSMSARRGDIYYTLDGSDPRLPGTSGPIVSSTTIVSENADKKVLVPAGSISDDWKSNYNFNDTSWTSGAGGVGYETGSGYEAYFNIDVREQMYNGNTSCYIRIPFTFDGTTNDINILRLNMRYDDGFIAYLNGTEVARANAPSNATWNSIASNTHGDNQAVVFQEFDISAYIPLLNQGQNILAVHGLNVRNSTDFLVSAELVAGQSTPSSNSGISPVAIEYKEPITFTKSIQVKARVLDGGTWSALNEAAFGVGSVAENLRITEIMYHPEDTGDPSDPNEEFIELKNIGAETINLNLVGAGPRACPGQPHGVAPTNSINFTFPSIELAAGEYVVIVQNRNAFEAQYGTNVNIAGQYSGKLNNAGERITLEDAIGRTIMDFRYEDGWRSITDGEGFSLTLIDPMNPDLNSWGEKDSWRPSAYAGGSPGYDDSGILPDPGAVVINEVLAHSHAEASDWIELYNTTGTAIDIGGWFLSDSNYNLFKYKIANGTTIDPNGYIVLYEDLNFGNANDPGSYEPFALSENGEKLYLNSAQNDVLTGYRSTEDFGASETGVSFGRYFKSSTGNYNFVAMDENTPDSANSYPKVGPIVISEIMYNPYWPDGGSYTNDEYEYIELHNISDEPVTLYNYETAEPWKFTNGIDFTFPADSPVTIPADRYLLVVKKPEAFSWQHPDVSAGIILGPYDGNLGNAGESLELGMPGDVDKENVRQYIRVDRINFSDGSHPENCPGSIDLWPIDTDGYGKSLTRRISTDYGNDPDNWFAALTSPGM